MSTNGWGLRALKLENIKLSGPVFAISLQTGAVQLNNPQEQNLLCTKNGVMSSLQLVSLLQAKLGEQVAFSLKLLDDYRPKRANVYSPSLSKHALSELLQGFRPSFLLPRRAITRAGFY